MTKRDRRYLRVHKADSPNVILSLVLSRDLADRLDIIAKFDERSRASVIRRILEQNVERYEKRGA